MAYYKKKETSARTKILDASWKLFLDQAMQTRLSIRLLKSPVLPEGLFTIISAGKRNSSSSLRPTMTAHTKTGWIMYRRIFPRIKSFCVSANML